MKFFKSFLNFFTKENDPLAEYENNQIKVKESLTNLLFQHSKAVEKQGLILDENEQLALDLEDSIKASDDDLSLALIEKLELNKEELQFLDEQLIGLSTTISELKETKKDIDSSKGRYSDLLSIHESKKVALQAKKEMLGQLNELNESRASLNSSSYLTKLKDEIHKANAQISLIEDETNSSNKLQALRKKRLKNEHLNKLNILKQRVQTNSTVVVK